MKQNPEFYLWASFLKNFTLQDQGPDVIPRNGIDVEFYRGFSSVQLLSRV